MNDRLYVAWVLTKVLARIIGIVALAWLTWKLVPILARGD